MLDANAVERLPVYIDGADEIDAAGHMIKGGGAALTREKIITDDMAERIVCIADESKLVKTLGEFSLPVEVIPMATAQVARRLRALGGEPRVREGVVTDNGCMLLDVHGLSIADPTRHGARDRPVAGRVVTVAIFARATRPTSVCSARRPACAR